ncbi:MAG: hypothetical protein WC797_00620 [Candidatus Paceibacterota bacterium]|jgi:hypothetical protein
MENNETTEIQGQQSLWTDLKNLLFIVFCPESAFWILLTLFFYLVFGAKLETALLIIGVHGVRGLGLVFGYLRNQTPVRSIAFMFAPFLGVKVFTDGPTNPYRRVGAYAELTACTAGLILPLVFLVCLYFTDDIFFAIAVLIATFFNIIELLPIIGFSGGRIFKEIFFSLSRTLGMAFLSVSSFLVVAVCWVLGYRTPEYAAWAFVLTLNNTIHEIGTERTFPAEHMRCPMTFFEIMGAILWYVTVFAVSVLYLFILFSSATITTAAINISLPLCWFVVVSAWLAESVIANTTVVLCLYRKIQRLCQR